MGCGSSTPAGAPKVSPATPPIPAGNAGAPETVTQTENTQPGVKLENLSVGEKIQVKSVSKNAWFEGEITKVDTAGATVQYKAAKGRLTTKFIPAQKVRSLLRHQSEDPPEEHPEASQSYQPGEEASRLLSEEMSQSKNHSESVSMNEKSSMANNFPNLEGNTKPADEATMPISGVPTPVPSPTSRETTVVDDPRSILIPRGRGRAQQEPNAPMTPSRSVTPESIIIPDVKMGEETPTFAEGRQTPAPINRNAPRRPDAVSPIAFDPDGKKLPEKEMMDMKISLNKTGSLGSLMSATTRSMDSLQSSDTLDSAEMPSEMDLTRKTSDGRFLKAFIAARDSKDGDPHLTLTDSAHDLVDDLDHSPAPDHRLKDPHEVHASDPDKEDDAELSDRLTSLQQRMNRLEDSAKQSADHKSSESPRASLLQLKAPMSPPPKSAPQPNKNGFTFVEWDGVKLLGAHTQNAEYKPRPGPLKSILTRKDKKKKKKKKNKKGKKKKGSPRTDDEESGRETPDDKPAQPQRHVMWSTVVVSVPTVPREPRDKVPPSQRFYNQMCEIFATLDKDQDGRLNLMEMKNFCQHVYNDCTDDDVITLCLQFSKTPTQGLDFQEWAHLVKATDPKLFSFADELYHKIVLGDYEDDTSSDDDDDSSDGGNKPPPQLRQTSGSSAGDSSDEDDPAKKNDIEVSTTDEGSHGTPSSSAEDVAPS